MNSKSLYGIRTKDLRMTSWEGKLNLYFDSFSLRQVFFSSVFNGSRSERRNESAENIKTKASEYFAGAPKTRAPKRLPSFFTFYYQKY